MLVENSRPEMVVSDERDIQNSVTPGEDLGTVTLETLFFLILTADCRGV